MKRFHVNVSVADLQRSVEFYTTLFASEPTVRKSDYAKWLLDDPRINFSISTAGKAQGIHHVGLQVESADELAALQNRLQRAGQATFDQPAAECCYAQSSKTWVRDPDDVAWETFLTHGEITHYGADEAPATVDELPPAKAGEDRCCA